MTQSPHRSMFDTFDGIVALGITTVALYPGSYSIFAPTALLRSQITLSDAVFGLVFIVVWHLTFSFLKLYDKFATIPSRMLATLKGVAFMLLLLIAYCHIFHPEVLSTRAILETTAALFCYEINRVSLSVYLLDRIAARDPRRAIIIGSGRRAGKAWRAIRTRYRLSISLIGFIDNRNEDEMSPDVARRLIGSLDDLNQIIVQEVVDLILIAMPIQSCYPLMQQAIHVAESAGIPIVYLDDIYSSRLKSSDPNQAIFRDLAPNQERYLFYQTTKRLADIVISITGLVLLSPLLIATMMAITLFIPGSLLIPEERFGYRRRRFQMLRFRTSSSSILPDPADPNSSATYPPLYSERHNLSISVTLGNILRKSSLYEVPQLWNVLMGDMSLVGPRPMSVQDVYLFDEAALMRRFSVRPGMTGLWQVTAERPAPFDQWVLLDNRYVDGSSLILDLKILATTIGMVLKRSVAS